MSNLHHFNVMLDNQLVSGGLTRYGPEILDDGICYKKCNIRCPNHEFLNTLMLDFLAEYSQAGKWEKSMRKRIEMDHPVSNNSFDFISIIINIISF